MPTNFEVLFLGNLPLIDTTEGNQFVSQAAVNSWIGTIGSVGDPLSNNDTVRDFAPGAAGFSGGITNAYDLDNNNSNDTFTIDGVEQIHDATILFDATLTFNDGTTANITAVLAQATNGDVYLLPEVVNNADAAALSSGPIASITLNAPIFANGQAGQGFNLSADRFASNFVPCFTSGTLIATPTGERLVQDLRPGDRVITRDNGLQMVRWAGQRELSDQDLVQVPDLRPILLRAGALAPGMPLRDMQVSPNHRMLMSPPQTEMMFGEREVLVAAKHLTDLDGVERVANGAVTYIHLMFTQHEVVLADGAWSESFQPGDYSLRGVGTEQRTEILALFPELANTDGLTGYQSARLSLKSHEAATLVAGMA